MESSAVQAISSEELLFQDGFGDRLLIRDTAGKPLNELLLLRSDLCEVPSFEFSLNQRLTSLEQFDHPSFVRVRGLMRVPGHLLRLGLVADYCAGIRLTDVLTAMEGHTAPRSASAPLFLIKEILGAVAALHRQNADVSHGALAPDRIVIADGKVRVTDYVMGSAIEQLRFSPERYWKELRVAVPASAGAVRFDKRLDVAQIGTIALSLFAGRQLRDDEHMGKMGAVLMGLSLPQPLQTWLLRTLHLDPRRAFVNVVEADSELEAAIKEAGLRPSPLELQGLGVRPQRRVTTIVVRPAAKAPGPIVVKSPVARVQTNQDPWRGHGVEAQTMYVPGTIAIDSVPRSRFSKRFKIIVRLGLFGALLAGAFTAAQYVPAPPSWFTETGTLVVETKPQGVPLMVDGQPQGVTPVTLQLESGRHEVELHGIGKPRIFNVYVSRGAHISQYIEMTSHGRATQPPKEPSY